MELQELILKRQATRKFDGKKVEKEKIDKILSFGWGFILLTIS